MKFCSVCGKKLYKNNIIGKHNYCKIKCSECGKEITGRGKTKLCKSCSVKGEKNGFYNSKKFCGINNPMYGRIWSVKDRKKQSELIKSVYRNNPEIRKNLVKNHWSKNRSKKAKVIERHSKLMSKLISEGKISINTGYRCGYYYSLKNKEYMYYHSSYELFRMEYLEQSKSVKSYTKNHGIRISYGKNKKYVPDFLIVLKDNRKILEEVKGWIRDNLVFESKNNAAVKYCRNNSISEFRVIFKDDIEKGFN